MDDRKEQQYLETLRKASGKIKTLLEENEALKQSDPIAVIGMGCRFPGGITTPDEFWQILKNGVDTVREIPGERWAVDDYYDPDPEAPGKMYTRQGAFMDSIDQFDPAFFGISPREAASMDPQHRLLLEVSWEALEHAGLDVSRVRGSETGVFIGYTNYDYFQSHIHSGDVTRITPHSASGVMVSTSAGRLAYFFDFHGPTITIDTACSSSLVSLHIAMRSLQQKECAMALTGGVTVLASPDGFVGLSKVKALSPSGRCHTFDQHADGYGRGEGCGVLVLKRLSDAEKDGDRIFAVIKGTAVNHDGCSNGLTAPNGPAQCRVIRRALAHAGMTPEDIDYIEAHGTGTILGDPIEVNALHTVFGAHRKKEESIRLGSVKTNIGHTEAAAGVAGVMKVVLSLYHKELPKSLHFNEPNAHIAWDEIPFRVVTSHQAWEKKTHRRAAGVSSFGLSGTNAHAIVQEYDTPQDEGNRPERPVFLYPLSARTDTALRRMASLHADFLAQTHEPFFDCCTTAACGRHHLRKRIAVLATSREELRAELQEFSSGGKTRNIVTSTGPAGQKGAVFLFTGQGAQFIGMGRSLYAQEPVFRDVVDRAHALLSSHWEVSLHDLLYAEKASEDRLDQTQYTQPALFVIEMGLAALWKSWGITPRAVIGHSIGEYAAAVVSGIMSFEDGLLLAVERAKRMQSLAPVGSMAAVAASREAVEALLQSCQGQVGIAAVNAPERITISGLAEMVDVCLEKCRAYGIQCKKLPVSHAFHSPLMKPMISAFEHFGSTIAYSNSKIPFYSTLTGQKITAKNPVNARYWGDQILGTVRFCDAIQAAVGDGFDTFVELGPTSTLSTLGRLCAGDSKLSFLSSLKKGENDCAAISRCLGKLYVSGFTVDWAGVYPESQGKRVTLPTYPFERKSYWNPIPSSLKHSNTPVPPCNEHGTIEEISIPKEKTKRFVMQDANHDRIVKELIDITSSVGGFDPLELQPNDCFLEIGLDSLLLFSVGQIIEKRYGVTLKVSQFFDELKTVADLAHFIEAHGVLDALDDHAAGDEAASQGPFTPSVDLPAIEKPTTPAMPASSDSMVQLMNQQLQQFTEMTSAHLQSFHALFQQQMSLLSSGSVSQPSSPSPADTKNLQAKPRSPKSVGSAEQFRSLNLKKVQVLNEERKQCIQRIVDTFLERTPTSKKMTGDSRRVLADWKHTLSFWTFLKEAKYPIISAKSQGARFWDVDGNEYLDIALGMGVHVFGHRPAFLVEQLERQIQEGFEIGPQSDLTGAVAQQIHDLTGVERVTFTNTGTEAVMVAIRLARAATKRTTIAIFRNSYHGIFDGVLATDSEEGIVPAGIGTPQGMIDDIVLLDYDNPASLAYIEAHSDDLAAVLVEPVQSRNPDLQPQLFLRKLRALTARVGTALIMDEMITGFRIHPGGAQAWFGIQADIVTYGKIAGGGLPIGVVAGKSAFLDYIDGGYWEYGSDGGPHSEMIYFGGTFARNPMTMAGAYAALSEIQRRGLAMYDRLNQKTEDFCLTLNYWFEQEDVPMRAKFFASQWRLVPTSENDTQPMEMELLFLLLLIKGVYTWERRINFFSTEHTDADVAFLLQTIKESVKEIRAGGFAFKREGAVRAQFVPLSSTQRRLLAICQQPGGEAAYHLSEGFWIDGLLDVDHLENCFAELLRRHESLRTCFKQLDGDWVQYRMAEPRFFLERMEASEDRVGEAVRQFIRPFDLSTMPLIRFGVIRVADQRYLLVGDAHHIVVDGMSFTVVANELMALYQGQGLPPVEYQFADCQAMMDEWLSSDACATQEAFWKTTLSGPLPVLNLPTDYPRPSHFNYKGDVVVRHIDKPVVQRLKTAAKQHGVSTYMIILAAYALLLQKLSGEEDIVIGMPVGGRLDARMANTVGMFVNTIAARIQVDSAISVPALLQRVKAVCSQAYDHQDYPFERMAAVANAGRPQGMNAIFDAMLSYEKTDDRVFRIRDLQFSPYRVRTGTAMFDVHLDVMEEGEELDIRFFYASQLFTPETIEKWAGYYVNLLSLFGGNQDGPVAPFEFVPEYEKNLLTRWNDTDAAYPTQKTIIDLFEEQVQRVPDRVAVVYNDHAITYRALWRQAEGIAAWLAAQHGAAPGERVGVLLPKSDRVIATFLGILMTGAAYVPMDPDYPEQRLAYLINDSACCAVVTEQRVVDSLPESVRGGLTVMPQPMSLAAGFTKMDADPEAIAYVIYTSGSTGNPKGCQIRHRNVVRLLKNEKSFFDFSENDVCIVAHSFCFDFSVWEMYGALLYGGKVIVPDPEAVRDTVAFHRLLRQHRVSVLNQTPAAFMNLIEVEDREPTHCLHEHVRMVIFGGDRLEPTLLAAWAQYYTPDQIALINMYGITETTVHVTYCRLRSEDICGTRWQSPIGVPLPETRVYICDANLNLQPVGIVGEIYVGGSGVGAGYLHLPELTQERFLQSPFREGEIIYKSGDLGRWLPDGTLAYLGRNDFQVQIRGFRVELGEIAFHLQGHAKIGAVEVLARKAPSGTSELIAYYTAVAPLGVDELRTFLEPQIPRYMIPSYFVYVDQFPLTSNGKVDRKALPLPEAVLENRAQASVAPRNPIEEQMAEIWASVLGLAAVGVEDDFFQLGGDSIKAILIQSQLYKAGLHLDIQWLFENHTVDQHHFNQAVLLKTQGRADIEILRIVVEELIKQHETLRLTYVASGDEVKAELSQYAADDIFTVVDLTSEQHPLNAMEAHAQKVQQSFQLSQGPLVYFVLYRLPDGDRLFVAMHHLITDGVSWRILLEDFCSGYTHVSRGESSAILNPATTYLAWVDALRHYETSPVLREEIAYWKKIDNAPVKPLPVDYAVSDNVYADEERITLKFSAAETVCLLQGANQRFQSQTFELLVAALAKAYSRWANNETLRIFVEGHGRESIDPALALHRTIGWFTTLYPLLLKLDAHQTLPDIIDVVKTTMRDVPHRGLGYSLIRYASDERVRKNGQLGSSFDLVFNYLGQFDEESKGFFTLSDDPVGKQQSERIERVFLLEWDALIIDKVFSVTLAYNRKIHRRESMQPLIDFFAEALREILAHVSSPTAAVLPTPSHPFKHIPSSLLDGLKHAGIKPEEVEDFYPLSSVQEGLLFHSIADEENAHYFVQMSYVVKGPLDMEAFRASWDELVTRNAVLRTAFLYDRLPEPMQVVLRSRPVVFLYEDWRQKSQEEQGQAFDAYVQKDRSAYFGLSRDTLMRVAVFQLSEQAYHVLWSHHHILMDGWSVSAMFDEWIKLYASLTQGSPVPEVTRGKYKDYIEWLERRDDSGEAAFWGSYFDGYSSPVSIPKDNVSRKVLICKKEQTVMLDRSQSDFLKAYSQRNHVTLHTVLQAVWAIVLRNLCKTDDSVFGMVFSGRPAVIDDGDRIMGLFLRTLPVRIQIKPGVTFTELAQSVQQRFLDCYAHQYYPLTKINESYPHKLPIFDHLFVFENYPLDEHFLNQRFQETLDHHVEEVVVNEVLDYDFTIEVYPEDEIRIRLLYNDPVIAKSLVDEIENLIRHIVSSLSKNENIAVHEISPIPSAKPGVAPSIDLGKTILDLVEAQAEKTPQAIAVEYDGKTYTYSELIESAASLASALVRNGLAKGAPVAVIARNGWNYTRSIMGIQKAGGVFVPISVDTPDKRMETILSMVSPHIVMVEEEDAARYRAWLKSIALPGQEPILLVLGARHDFRLEDVQGNVIVCPGEDFVDLEAVRPQPTDAMYIIFTSGTTGTPKAIFGSHEGLSHFIQWEVNEFELDSSIRVSNLATTMFDVSLRDIFVPLAAGGTLCIPSQQAREDYGKLIHWFEEACIGLTHIVPSVYRILLQEIQSQGIRKPWPQLQYCLLAGEPLYGRDILQGREWLGRSITFVNVYGPSETTLAQIFYRVPDTIGDPNRMLAVGKPITDTKVLICKGNRAAKPGEIGEVMIQPPFACLGYYAHPGLNAAAYVPNPLTNDSQDIYYKTGDMGRWTAEGTIELLGRMDRQVKVKGVRVELPEVDQAVMGYKGVAQAFSIVQKRDDDENTLICYYTETEAVEIHSLRESIQHSLPAAFVPEFFVRLDRFPTTLNGKVDTRSLPKPEAVVFEENAYRAPASETERKIEEIWKEVLGLERISVDSSFLSIGGNSLKAIRLISRMNRTFDADLRIKVFFENATIEKLAVYVEQQKRKTTESAAAQSEQADYEVSHAQRRLWIMNTMENEPKAYSVPGALRFDGAIHAHAIEKAFKQIIDRHEILRTTFKEEAGVLRQVVHPHIDFSLRMIDLRSEKDAEEKARELCGEEAEKPFDLLLGPLLRSILFTVDDDRHILFFVIHHIVFDGWSLTVLTQEFLALYDAILKGEVAALPELTLQYKDFAQMQNTSLRNGSMKRHPEFWKKRFEVAYPDIELPLDFPHPPTYSFDGETLIQKIDKPIVEAFRMVCLENHCSLYMGMVALIRVLLYRYSGQSRFVLGSPIAGRDQQELENQIGFFVNTLVLADEVTDEENFTTVLQRTRDVVTEAFEHAEYPFDSLVDDIVVERDLSRPPLVEVMVVYQNFEPQNVALDGVAVEEFYFDFNASKFPLSFIFEESGDGTLIFKVEYNTDLFLRDRVERMMRHLTSFMVAMDTQRSQPISRIDFLPEEERRLLTHQFAVKKTVPIPYSHLMERFVEIVSRYPDLPAVVCEEVCWTYRELDEHANRIARWIQHKVPIQKGQRIAVMLERSEWLPAAFLGILKLGAVYVPIDPAYPAERIAYMLTDSACDVTLCDAGHSLDASRIRGTLLSIQESSGFDASPVLTPQKHDDLAFLIYTSGSTGEPKGVMLTHGGMLNHVMDLHEGWDILPEDRVLQFASISFDASVCELLLTLLRGACLVIVPRERIMNLQRFVEYGKTQKVTVAILPPSYLHTLPVDSLPHLRTLITAGESPQIHDVKQWRKKVTYINAYGPTESSICTTYYKVQPDDDLDTPIPAGKPLQNFDVYVVDKNNQRMPIGIVGEIIVGGAYLAQGYWKKDELTKQSFVSHPFKEGMRLYRTGDYGYWRADGELVFVGRRDDQVKIRGYRVELREVEKNISAFDSVTETVVMQHKRNNGNSDLIGYVVSSQKVEWEQLRMYLRKTLPDYMIPSLWVALDEIPLLPNRKVDHSQLPLPAKDTFCTAEIVHAETDMEQQILAVWKTVLGIDDLGVTQRFFEYGGDSIRAIQIVSQLKDVGLELDVRDLFQYQTVRELAHYLKQCSPASFTAKQKQYTSPGMSRVKMSAEEFESIFDDE